MTEYQVQKRALSGDTVVRFASLDEANRTCEFVASTESIDAHRSIVKQNWRLDRFRANPVILFGHDFDKPVGTAEARIESGTGLVLAVKFATDDECAERAWNLVKQRVLRGMSVQFRPGKVGYERIGEADILVYDDCELLEASIVSVPSNPETLARDLETDEANRGRSGVNPMSDKTEAPVAPPAPVPVPAPVAEVRSEPAPAPPPAAPVPDVVSRSMHESALAALQGTISEQRTALTATEKRAADAEAKLKVLDDERLVRKVDSFVGPKLLPAQRDAWLVLARSSEPGFDALIAIQPDLAIVGAPVIPPAAGGTRATDAGASKMKRLNELVAECRKATGKSEVDARVLVMDEHPELCTDD